MNISALRGQSRSPWWGVLKHLKQVAIILGAYFIYMLLRKFIIADSDNIALENAVKIISFEAAAGMLWELSWHEWAIDASHALVVFFNWAYIVTFFPIILATALIVYLKDRPKYFYYRNVILLSFAIALIVFGVFPLAPPRFLPEYGFIDSIQHYGPSWYGGREMAFIYNAFAAMPSLHFGWTVVFGMVFMGMKPLPIKVLGVIYPVLTFFAITVTANHYIMDAIGGVVVMAVSLVLYESLLRLRSRYGSHFSTMGSHLRRAAGRLNEGLQQGGASAKVGLGTARSYLRMERPSNSGRRLALPLRISFVRERRP